MGVGGELPWDSLFPIPWLEQWSPTFLATGTGFVEDNFSKDQGGGGDGLGMFQAYYIYCALYFYYYYIVIYNEIIIQLTIMQNQWKLWAYFTCHSLIGFFFFLHIYWSIIALQWCVSFCFIAQWISYTHTYTYIPISPLSCVSLPSSLSHPSRWSQST